MASSMKLSIITPEKKFYAGEITELMSENNEGKFGILPHHIDYITVLKPAATIIKDAQGNTKKAFTSSGILKMIANEIVMLCDAAEWPEDINTKRANEAKERAESRLSEKNSSVDVERAELALKRAMVRLKISDIK